MKLPQTSLRMVLQTPHNPETEKLFKEVQAFILEKGFGIMPPKKSILKIELVDLCYMAIPPKLPFNVQNQAP